MNQLRDEVTDVLLKLVFCSFPGITHEEFRCFVHEVLRLIDYTVTEVVREDRHCRYRRSLNRSRN